MSDRNRRRTAFRIDFEQQSKRAKELLRAARAGRPEALARFRSAPKLAEAQYRIAQELRFADWAALKRHTADMARARDLLGSAAPDDDARTLHVRCGSDLQPLLTEAGFHGDYYEHSYPYLIGPVTEGPQCLMQRARFILECYAECVDPPWDREDPHLLAQHLRRLEEQERRLHDSVAYERVVLWFEHDCMDQLTLLRLLAHYATHGAPSHLELIAIGDFPGARRFIGLGELPPEALQLLWKSRRPCEPAQLRLGAEAWRALANPDPRPLAAILRSGTPALPLLAPALHRHLRELPALGNGLGLTEELALTSLAQRPHSLEQLFAQMVRETDPLPGQGDWNVCHRVLQMQGASGQVYTRTPGRDRHGRARAPWTDVFSITDLGRAVLGGAVDFRALRPPRRWVGGVEVAADQPDWRWDERRLAPLRR